MAIEGASFGLQLGGSSTDVIMLAITSQPGQGTSITLRVPTTRVRAQRREAIQIDGDKHRDSFY